MANDAGEDVLSWLSFGHTSIKKTLGSEGRILAFYYWLTFCILKAGKPKFQQIEPAAAAVGTVASAGNAAASVGGGEAAAAAAVIENSSNFEAAAAVATAQAGADVVE